MDAEEFRYCVNVRKLWLLGATGDKSRSSYPRWRSGRRWVWSSQHAQTLWLCSSDWCHASPRSSQRHLWVRGRSGQKKRCFFVICINPTLNIYLCWWFHWLGRLIQCYLNTFRHFFSLKPKTLARIQMLLSCSTYRRTVCFGNFEGHPDTQQQALAPPCGSEMNIIKMHFVMLVSLLF